MPSRSITRMIAGPDHFYSLLSLLVEPVVNISASVSGNTDIDTNQSTPAGQLSAINNKNFPITYPQTDLKICVYQDNRHG